MIIKQFYLGCLSHASYIIADERSGEALIVDPQRDIDTYAPFLAEHGLQLIATALTHFHADFVAGHIELQERYGIPIYLGERASADFTFTGLADGDEIQLGSIKLKTLATPGHTPEGISFLVHDEAGSPHAVLTGDTLFVGDVGRPDLLASVGVSAKELAEMLYNSLHQKLMTLDDAVLVYPAHGAGSLCGKHLSAATVSTIGEQRAHNYALQEMSLAAFVELMSDEQPTAPAYFLYDAEMNKTQRQTLEMLLQKADKQLSVAKLRGYTADAVQIVDIRGNDEIAQGYYRAAINIGLVGKYATWAGSVLKTDVPIVLITHADDHEEAILRLGRIGFDNVLGYIPWEVLRPELSVDEIAKPRPVLGEDLAAFFKEQDTQVIDVRSAQEFALGHFPDAEHIPLGDLYEQMRARDRGQRILVHCAGGYRSSAAVTLLAKLGFENIYELAGGFRPEYIQYSLSL